MVPIYCDNKILFYWENKKTIPAFDTLFIFKGFLYRIASSLFYGNERRIFVTRTSKLIGEQITQKQES